ncbi:hypothetical protein LP420_29855 [Massilia sp. B-10]|nr:hypothetical protein LP420_29855 [Massilia sp. B-10]
MHDPACAADEQQLVTTHRYDANGNERQTIDPRQQGTDRSFDTLNRLEKTEQPAPRPGRARPQIRLAHDGLDQLTAVTDPRSLVISYGVDGIGRQSLLTSPDTGKTAMAFDAALSNVLTQTDGRLKTTRYVYDALNRVKSIAYASGVASTFEYDGGVGGAMALLVNSQK